MKKLSLLALLAVSAFVLPACTTVEAPAPTTTTTTTETQSVRTVPSASTTTVRSTSY